MARNVDLDIINDIKFYQTLIKNGNLYDAKRLDWKYETENETYTKKDYIITAAVVNSLSEQIMKNEQNLLQYGLDWMNYDKGMSSWALDNDYSLR